MVFLSNEKRIQLQNIGYQVIDETDQTVIDAYNTTIFLVDPKGKSTPYYDSYYDIPVLPHGTDFSFDFDRCPSEANYDDCGVYLHLDPQLVATYSKQGKEVEYRQLHALGKRGLHPIALGVAIIIIVVIGILVTYAYLIVDRVNIIHGKNVQIDSVDDATKAITKPNCQARLWDAVNHTWVAGDDWSEPGTTPGEELARWIKYIVIGVVAIAGAYVVMKILTKPEQPTYVRAPDIGYVGE